MKRRRNSERRKLIEEGKIKVHLFQIESDLGKGSMPPLGLLSMATYLRQNGYWTEVIDRDLFTKVRNLDDLYMLKEKVLRNL